MEIYWGQAGAFLEKVIKMGPWVIGESHARSLGVRIRQKQRLSESPVALGQDE